MQCVKHFRANYGKFTDHNLEKLCPRSLALASTIPVLGIERVCPRKVGSWHWSRIFFESLGLGLEGCVFDSTSGNLIQLFCGLIRFYMAGIFAPLSIFS